MSLCPYKACINFGRYCRRLHTDTELKSKTASADDSKTATVIKHRSIGPTESQKDWGNPKNWNSDQVFPPNSLPKYENPPPPPPPKPKPTTLGNRKKPPTVKKKPSNLAAKSKRR